MLTCKSPRKVMRVAHALASRSLLARVLRLSVKPLALDSSA
jgi:hypothetical protein